MALKYRIGLIGWYNFETLVQTLLKALIGPGVTSFGGTKDDGRDASFSGMAEFPSRDTKWDGSWLFQAKYVDLELHGASAARTQLKKAFRQECKSILASRKLENRPDNYVLITDVPLTSRNREDLGGIIHDAGFDGNFGALDGKEVCEFLDLYPEVRRSYPQLLGLADLERILSRELYVRSEAYVRQWQPRLATFVQTQPYRDALRRVREHHFVVLDGPPEAGKSTIAAALALLHATSGFEVVDVRGPEDIFEVYDRAGKQFFVADDAVGSISFEPSLTDRWSRDLRGVLRTLGKEHLLVWTARSYILEEAVAESRLGDAIRDFPGIHEVLVEAGKLTLFEKAEILYNHAKRAKLSEASRALVRDNARRIASHPNFTPERVRQLVEHFLPGDTKPNRGQPVGSSWRGVSDFLKNPGVSWVQAYDRQSRSEQTLLLAMLDSSSVGGSCKQETLRRAYQLRCDAQGGPARSFDECVSRLEHSFLRVTASYSGQKFIDFQHPSLRDMLISRLRGDELARRRYMQLASPVGLSKLIQGVAASGTRADRGDHLVVPRSEEELSLLLDRLTQLSSAVLAQEDWHRILSALELLVPRGRSKGRLPPAQVDLGSFGGSWQGRLVHAVLSTFNSMDTYQRSRRYTVGEWITLLERYYEVAVYLVPPLGLVFLPQLAEGLDTLHPADAIAFASLVHRWEPLIIRQVLSPDLLRSWDSYIRYEIEALIETGDNFPTSDDYDDYYMERYMDGL